MNSTNPKSVFAKAASAARSKAESVSEKATGAAKRASEMATDAAAKINDTAEAGKLKIMEGYYRPVFPEEYMRDDYSRPKMIAISDGSDRRDIEVCEGSIG